MVKQWLFGWKGLNRISIRKTDPDMLQLPKTKGIYIIAFRLEKLLHLCVRTLGEIDFYPGWYLYCGSAKNKGGLQSRIDRHLNRDTIQFWHIDYLKTDAVVQRIWFLETSERSECGLVHILGSTPIISTVIPGFGSSDCSEKCGSHLLFTPSDTDLDNVDQFLKRSVPEIKLRIVWPE